MLDFSRFDWRPVLRHGLLAGVIALSLCAIGMVEAFNERQLISGVLTLGQVLLFSAPALVGYLSARENDRASKVALLIGGFIASLLGTGGIFELNVLGFILAVVAAVILVGIYAGTSGRNRAVR